MKDLNRTVNESLTVADHFPDSTKMVHGYDFSNVIHLTHNKAQHIIERDGYVLTGFVLTKNKEGRHYSKCIVDMSAVRWFDDGMTFFRMMHAPTPKEWLHAPGEEPVNTRSTSEYSEPVKQEPVAHYKDAPHTIYLQTGCDDLEDCECSFNEWGDTTWCADQIHDTDIPYIRADYAAPVSAEAIRAEALEQAEEIAKTIGGSFSVEFLAAIRGLK